MSSKRDHAAQNRRIKDLLVDASGHVGLGPRDYYIGDGGKSWLAKVGYEYDRMRVWSAKMELRDALKEKIDIYESSFEDPEKVKLLRKLKGAIRRSDTVLLETASLVGTKPSDGLFTKITTILKKE